MAMLAVGVLTACNSNKQTKENNMKQELQLTQEWDKVFPLSEKVNHRKVTFETQYGLTLAADPKAMAGGVIDPLPDDAPQFVKDYYDYYKGGVHDVDNIAEGTRTRGYHARSGNSNDGWRVIGTQAYANSRFLYYINEIRSAVMIMHGEKAHSRYFGEAAYKYMVEGKAEGFNFVGKPNPVPENKRLLIIPDASHCDLYDGGYTELVGKGEPKNMIPWDKLEEFFKTNLK